MQYKYVKWSSELGTDICQDIVQFGTLFRDIYKVTNIPKLRSFQYRLLQRGIVTNIHLAAWNIVDSELCSFCQNERESILHLMCECPVVKEFWQQIVIFMRKDYGITDIEITQVKIITNQIAKNRLACLRCLMVKQYIYRQKCQRNNLSIHGFVQEVNKIRGIEKYIAIKNERITVHEKKWCLSTVNVDSSTGNFITDYVSNM